MKYVLQFGIIIGITFLGEFLNKVVPLPVPTSVWGMGILFASLCFGIIKLEHVEETSDFLLSIMTIMYVPVGAGLMQNYLDIKSSLFSVLTIIVISTIICFFVTGFISQMIILRKTKKIQKTSLVEE